MPPQIPAAELERYLAARPALAAHQAVRRVRRNRRLICSRHFTPSLAPLLPALAPLWTHNDLHASNLLWSDAGEDAHATAIIDFGLADRTNAVHDLAHAIERNIVEWLRSLVARSRASHPEDVPVHFDHLHALLDGYESVRPLAEDEAAALAPMTALCHAEFALSEADYFLGVLHSEDRAAMAYDGWLVGHARWFRGRRRPQAAGRAATAGPIARAEACAHDLDRHYRPISPRTGLEIAGMVTTVLGIWLTTRRLLICWPVVLLADILYLVVFYRARLFSDALLQVFFVVFTLYGWWHWWRGVRAGG